MSPVANMVLTFRGDTRYRVQRLRSPGHGSRISVVVEQYMVPPEYEHTLYTYWSTLPTFVRPVQV